MKITCGIIINDKDYHNLKNIIPNILRSARAKGYDFEIIVADNRKNNVNDVLDIEPEYHFKHIKYNDNFGTFYARKSIFENSSGDYIWYIDGDDNISSFIDKKFFADGAYDLYCFNYSLASKNTYYTQYIFDEEELVPSNPNLGFLSEDLFKKLTGNLVWTKWIKRDVLQKVFEPLKEMDAKDINVTEDTIICFGSFYFAKNVKLIPEQYYVYNDRDSISIRDKYTKASDYKTWITGAKKGFTLFDKVIPVEVQNETGISSVIMYRNDLFDFLKAFERCEPSILEDCFSYLCEFYPLEYIKKTLSIYANDAKLSLNLRAIIWDLISRKSGFYVGDKFW